MSLRGLFERLSGIFRTRSDNDLYAIPPDMVEAHRLVTEYFPDTPWVAGGVWSWCSGSPEEPNKRLPMVYPYLPLVLLLKEDPDLVSLAERSGVSCHVIGRPLSELKSKLDRLRETAIAIVR